MDDQQGHGGPQRDQQRGDLGVLDVLPGTRLHDLLGRRHHLDTGLAQRGEGLTERRRQVPGPGLTGAGAYLDPCQGVGPIRREHVAGPLHLAEQQLVDRGDVRVAGHGQILLHPERPQFPGELRVGERLPQHRQHRGGVGLPGERLHVLHLAGAGQRPGQRVVGLGGGELPAEQHLRRLLETAVEGGGQGLEHLEQGFVLGHEIGQVELAVELGEPVTTQHDQHRGRQQGRHGRALGQPCGPTDDARQGGVLLGAERLDREHALGSRSTVEHQAHRRDEGHGEHEGGHDPRRREDPEGGEEVDRAGEVGEEPDRRRCGTEQQGQPHGAVGDRETADRRLAPADLGAVAGEQVDGEVHTEPDDEDRHDLGLW